MHAGSGQALFSRMCTSYQEDTWYTDEVHRNLLPPPCPLLSRDSFGDNFKGRDHVGGGGLL